MACDARYDARYCSVYAVSTARFAQNATVGDMTSIRKFQCAMIGAAAVAGICAVVASPATAPATTRIHLSHGDWPGSVTSAFGSIWVASHVGTGLYRFNPRTNRLVKWIRIGENQCVDLVAGGGSIWVSNCSGETGHGVVYQVSPKTNRVIGHLSGQAGTFGDGSLWTQSQDFTRLLRVDPKSHLVLARIKLPTPLPTSGHVFPAAVCGGSEWSVADTEVIRYDTATNTVAAVIQLPGAASSTTARGGYFDADYAACAGGKVWVPNLAGLYSIDERTNKARRLPVRIRPNSSLGDPGLTAAGGQVFVRTSDSAVTEVDAKTGKVVHRYPAGGGGGEQIAVANRSVWIPGAAASAVWRDRLVKP
jgi:outer membrane protein assembly factor BamB